MLKKTITYTDYNGNERTEEFYFNLTKTEVIGMQIKSSGGLTERMRVAVANQDVETLFEIFKDLIRKSYGEKSIDGRRFVKSDELSDSFLQSDAYDVLFEELTTNDVAASEFINGIIPSDMDKLYQKYIDKVNKENNN